MTSLAKTSGPASVAPNATPLNELVRKMETRTATIGIIGLGYVGLPLILRYVEAGFKVLGFDIDQSKVDKLNSSQSYIGHIAAERIKEARQKGFEATVDY